MSPLYVSPLLGAVVGEGPKPRPEIIKRLWAYINSNNLLNDRRTVRADSKLLPLFEGRTQVNMFEMTRLVFRHTVSLDWQISWVGDHAEVKFSVTSGAGVLAKAEDHASLCALSPYLDQAALPFAARIADLEALISSPQTTERDLQKFLEDNPAFLLGAKYLTLYSQVVLEHQGGSLIPDFFLEPSSRFCDMLEIKKTDAPLLVGGRNRRRFSHAVLEGVAQLREYSRHFEDVESRKKLELKHGLKAYRPKLTLLIGRAPYEADEDSFRALKSELPISVMTYDDLAEEARALLRNVERLSAGGDIVWRGRARA